MPTSVSRAAYDTYTAAEWQWQNFGNKTFVAMSSGTNHHRYGYLYFSGIPPHGATVLSATLSIWLTAPSGWSGGPHTISVKRVLRSWSESKLMWGNSGSDQNAGTTIWGTAVVTNGADGQQVDIDLTSLFAAIQAGTYSYHGLRLEVDTGDNIVREIYGSESMRTTLRPQLSIVWSRPPDTPTSLAPAGGAAVSLAKPTLKWVFKDPDGDDQAKYRVQIGTDTAFASPEYDSGWVTDYSKQLDTSATTWTGVPSGATRYWRVAVADVNGLYSQWSPAASFTMASKGALSILNPPNNGYVEETTPPITTALTHDQDSIAYNLEELQPDGSWNSVWASGRFEAAAASGTNYTHGIPAGKISQNGTNYRLTVWSYDTTDREATPGDPVYVSARSLFTFQRSTVPAPVTGLTITGDGPGSAISFSRSTEPDYFALRVDGVLKFDRLKPSTFMTSTGNYTMHYYGARPNTNHTYEVEAIVSDGGVLKHSQGNNTVTYKPGVQYIWLVDDNEAPYASNVSKTMVRIAGQENQDLTIGESSQSFYAIGRRDPVYIADSIRGLEGTITGTVLDEPGAPYMSGLESMRYPWNVGRTYRLVYGTYNFPVQITSISISQLSSIEPMFQVSVGVAQVGEF